MKKFIVMGPIQSPEGPYAQLFSLGTIFASLEEATAAALARIRAMTSPGERSLTDLEVFEVSEDGLKAVARISWAYHAQEGTVRSL